jgi:hypothetical protein
LLLLKQGLRLLAHGLLLTELLLRSGERGGPVPRRCARAQGMGGSDRTTFTVTSCRGGVRGQTSMARRK